MNEYRFNKDAFKMWKDDLSYRLTLNPNPNGYYENKEGIKCDLRELISHELNRYFSYILNYGTLLEKEPDIKFLVKLIKFFDQIGEIQVIQKIISAPKTAWNLANKVIGVCNILYRNGLCSKECKDGEELEWEKL
jgi:hypothetical protein